MSIHKRSFRSDDHDEETFDHEEHHHSPNQKPKLTTKNDDNDHHHYGIFISNCLLSTDVVEAHILSYLNDKDLLRVACTSQFWRFVVGLHASKRDLLLFDENLSLDEMKFGLSLLWKSITLVSCKYEQLISTFHCDATSLTIIGGQTNRAFVKQLCEGKFDKLQLLAFIICGYSIEQVHWLCDTRDGCFPMLNYFNFAEQRAIVSHRDEQLRTLQKKFSHVKYFNMKDPFTVDRNYESIERRHTELTYLARHISRGTPNYERAFKYYSMAAESGDGKALEYVGYMYETGKGTPKNNTRAFYSYLSGANVFHSPDFALRVARMYEHGIGIPRDLKKACEYYEKCAFSRPEAALFMARVYEHGLEEVDIPIDESKALEFYKIADSSNAEIQFKIGLMYELGKGTPVSLPLAVSYYLRSARLGYTEADFALGRLALQMLDLPLSPQAALEHLKKAAENNHLEALFELGNIYEHGLLNEKIDNERALKYFELAAEKQSAAAQCKLGFNYDTGSCKVERNVEKAIQWYSKAAENGDTIALQNLGNIYLHGRGVPVDVERAFNYLKLSAEKGNADSALTIGQLYVKGGTSKNITKDISKAVHYFTQALSLNPNHTRSMYEIGKLHERRLVEHSSDFTALDWYLRACMSSHDEFLESCYKVVKIAGRLKYLQYAYSKFNQLLKRANSSSSSSLPLVFYLLGKIHEKGHLVGVDHSQAFNYYEKSATLGFEMARKRLENMELVI
ncbi:hypothetical protein FDP41_010650 [Naegleria fowleri]|uniref:Uncharacterized protein n=1 Tax=Naegleria fowleri TaxID=5763 RepID=A0A6A5CDZ3_NAEFO|nr:uncharacterized protein FDP41_010650 [Naegleria fowleri]KAF0983585.1 hypothetical protein FDP41_010650 [Naegleria fowleri]